jgi:hypothetical protein
MKITSTIRETGEQLAALRSYVQQMNGGEETKSGEQVRKRKDGECDGCCQPLVYIVGELPKSKDLGFFPVS